MRARLLADADLRYAILTGLRRTAPAIDFQRAQGFIGEKLQDNEVLALGARLGRVVVSHDRKTMPGHFYRFLEVQESPGLILIRQRTLIGLAIDQLHMVWACTEAAEFRNRIVYLPL